MEINLVEFWVGACLGLGVYHGFALFPLRHWVWIPVVHIFVYRPSPWAWLGEWLAFIVNLLEVKRYINKHLSGLWQSTQRFPMLDIDLDSTTTRRETVSQILTLPRVLRHIIAEYVTSEPDESWIICPIGMQRKRLIGHFQGILVFEKVHDFGVHGSLILWDVVDLETCTLRVIKHTHGVLIFATSEYAWVRVIGAIFRRDLRRGESVRVCPEDSFFFATAHTRFVLGHKDGIRICTADTMSEIIPWPETKGYWCLLTIREHLLCAYDSFGICEFFDLQSNGWMTSNESLVEGCNLDANTESRIMFASQPMANFHNVVKWGNAYVMQDDEKQWFIYGPLKKQ